MKTILAFGDSLTWGYDAPSGRRYPFADRWPTVLEAGLGGKARVIAEGLNGRTTAYDDHTAAPDRNGARILPTLLSTHSPLDAVLIMLGSNDIKPFLAGAANGAAAGLRRLCEIVARHPYDGGGRVPALLIISPPPCGPSDLPGGAPSQDRDIAESARLAPLYAQVGADNGAAFFDAGAVARVGRADGLHLDVANTRAIGTALVPVVSRILGL